MQGGVSDNVGRSYLVSSISRRRFQQQQQQQQPVEVALDSPAFEQLFNKEKPMETVLTRGRTSAASRFRFAILKSPGVNVGILDVDRLFVRV